MRFWSVSNNICGEKPQISLPQRQFQSTKGLSFVLAPEPEKVAKPEELMPWLTSGVDALINHLRP